jgi:hypothetical protein
MMTTATPSLADHLTISMAEVRASIAAEGTRKGLKTALLAAILGFLEMLAALLAEFRAGTLVAAAPRRGATCTAADKPAADKIWPVPADHRADHEPPLPPRVSRAKPKIARLIAPPWPAGCCLPMHRRRCQRAMPPPPGRSPASSCPSNL